MNLIAICKAVEFSAAHRIYDESLSYEQNQQAYGKCINDHGHNYRLVVCLKGSLDKDIGMFFNMTTLKKEIEEQIIQKLDHQHLNQLPEFKSCLTTTENLAVWIWGKLEPRFKQGMLSEVKLYETDNNFVIYNG